MRHCHRPPVFVAFVFVCQIKTPRHLVVSLFHILFWMFNNDPQGILCSQSTGHSCYFGNLEFGPLEVVRPRGKQQEIPKRMGID